MPAALKRAAIAACLLSPVQGTVVVAGSLTSVTVEAPLYDERLSADGGCDPAGCEASLTRDGDATTADSRWSCKPDLGDGSATCSITYTLADVKTIDSLDIALHKGDERTRTMGIYVDGVKATTWTSSGSTTAFENIELGAAGQTIELRGVLADSEWLSITEVEILVDDGGGAGDDDPVVEDNDDEAVVDGIDDDNTEAVEAGTVGTVTATAALYDPRSGSANGCDPDGCTAALTRDGDLSEASRWSCASSLGGTCSISYDLGATRNLSELRLALYKGAARVRTVEVHVDGVLATTWTSSGTTNGFEVIDLSGYSGRYLSFISLEDEMEWLSIVETVIMVLRDGATPPRLITPAPTPVGTWDPATPGATSAETRAPVTGSTPAPTPTPILAPTSPRSPAPALPNSPAPAVPTSPAPTASPSSLVEVGAVSTVTTTATIHDPRPSSENGCDPSGCTAGLTRDGSLSPASRWSCSPNLGDEGSQCTISYNLGAAQDISEIRVAMYEGTSRVRTMYVRVDGVLVTIWTSSGTTDDFETIDLPAGTSGLVVGITGKLAESEWISIVETQIMVPSDGSGSTPALASLETVGLLPLARGRGSVSSLGTWHAKDGDMSTSWTCEGEPYEPEDALGDCYLVFNLFYYRHIKQIKIALADGAERATQMRISANGKTEVLETFVTSSGSTEGFETFEFDQFTKWVTISGVFESAGQSISISEVEFVEEVQADEVPVVDITSLYGTLEPGFSAFEWSSDSDGGILTFKLAFFAAVTAIELRFPVGDTYKFDLQFVKEGGFFYTDPLASLEGRESTDAAGWQSFDVATYLDDEIYVSEIRLVVTGTGSGASGFRLLDARIKGTVVENPSDTFYVGSARIQWWEGIRYPDFVAEGTGDQRAIMGAICSAKKGYFDGDDCVGGDEAATGTVKLPMGEWYVDGSIIMKSGVHLDGRFSIDDSPYTTDIILEEGAADDTDISSLIVMDAIEDAKIESLFIRGQYDPESSNDSPEVGLGPACLSILNSRNITCKDTDLRFCNGDGLVVRKSLMVSIDAGGYDEEYLPWTTGRSRGTGLLVDSSESVWIRRHTVYDNGVAGIHIMGSQNFTFEATIAYQSNIYSGDFTEEGEGNVGSLDGQQPMEVIIEDSNVVTFNDMKVQSTNDPVMTVSNSSAVSFNNCGFSNVATSTCVIQTDGSSAVAVGDDPELSLVGNCFLKV